MEVLRPFTPPPLPSKGACSMSPLFPPSPSINPPSSAPLVRGKIANGYTSSQQSYINTHTSREKDQQQSISHSQRAILTRILHPYILLYTMSPSCLYTHFPLVFLTFSTSWTALCLLYLTTTLLPSPLAVTTAAFWLPHLLHHLGKQSTRGGRSSRTSRLRRRR